MWLGAEVKGKAWGVNLSVCEGCQCSEIKLKRALLSTPIYQVVDHSKNLAASHQTKCRAAQIAREETGALFLLEIQGFFFLSLLLPLALFPPNPHR